MRRTHKSDHPGYSFERTHWVLITGVGPLNLVVLQNGSVETGQLGNRTSGSIPWLNDTNGRQLRNG